jgi:uncharacterized membrane protein
MTIMAAAAVVVVVVMMMIMMMTTTTKATIVKMTDQWKDLDTLLIIRRVTDTSVNRPSSITGLRIE